MDKGKAGAMDVDPQSLAQGGSETGARVDHTAVVTAKGLPRGTWSRGKYYFPFSNAACAAARRATGTRKGEHDT